MEIGGREVGVMPSICLRIRWAGSCTVGENESQMIINVTNDGWFQESEGAAQHFRNSFSAVSSYGVRWSDVPIAG